MKINFIKPVSWVASTGAVFYDRSTHGTQLFLILCRYALALTEIIVTEYAYFFHRLMKIIWVKFYISLVLLMLFHITVLLSILPTFCYKAIAHLNTFLAQKKHLFLLRIIKFRYINKNIDMPIGLYVCLHWRVKYSRLFILQLLK